MKTASLSPVLPPAALVLGLALGLTSGCRRAPDSSDATQSPARPRVTLAWCAAPTGPAAALLDRSAGPASRLLRVPGFTNLAALDAALLGLQGVRPVIEVEPAQAGVVRLRVDCDLASESARPPLVAALKMSLAEGLEDVRWAPERQEGTAARYNGLELALEHRAELFRQMAAAFHAVTTVSRSAVLTNAPAVIETYATLAEHCVKAAGQLDRDGGRCSQPSSSDWASPFGSPATGAVFLGAFPSDWRGRARALGRWIPEPPSTNSLARAPIPAGWLERLALEHGPLPLLRQTVEASAQAWERRSDTLIRARDPLDAAGRMHHVLMKAVAASCAADRSDLLELERRCRQVSPENAPANLRVAYRDVALAARKAAARLSEVIRRLEGRLPEPRATDVPAVAKPYPCR